MSGIVWKNVTVEAAAIVVSILLAFAIDAWWEERQQQAEDKEVMRILLAELTERQIALGVLTRYTAAIQQATAKLLAAPHPEAQDIAQDEVDTALEAALWSSLKGFLVSPSLQSVFNGGRLADVRNAELLAQLTKLQSLIETTNDLMAEDRDFFDEALIPYLRLNSDLVQIVSISPGMPAGIARIDPVDARVVGATRNHAALLVDPVFRNLLLERTWKLDDIENNLPILEDNLAGAIDQLKWELEH